MSTGLIIIIFILIILVIVVLVWYFFFFSSIPTNALKYGDNIKIVSNNSNKGSIVPCGDLDDPKCKNNVVIRESNTQSNETWTVKSTSKKNGSAVLYGDDVIFTSSTGGNLFLCGMAAPSQCGRNVGLSSGTDDTSLWTFQKISTTDTSTNNFVILNTDLLINSKSANIKLSVCGSVPQCGINVTLRTDDPSSTTNKIWQVQTV